MSNVINGVEYENDFEFGGVAARAFCSNSHPDNDYQEPEPALGFLWCRRQAGHPGRHAAFGHSIKTPVEW